MKSFRSTHLQQRETLLVALDDGVDHRRVRAFDLLLHVQHHQVVGEPVDARQRHSPQKRRLAHAVATDQTVVAACVQTEGGSGQQLVAVDGDVHALQIDVATATQRASSAREEDGVDAPLVVFPLVQSLGGVHLLALLLLLLLDLLSEDVVLRLVAVHEQVSFRLEL